MDSFFETQVDGRVRVSEYFWIYWVLTVPVTLLVFATWWLWNTLEKKNIRRLEVDREIELDDL